MSIDVGVLREALRTCPSDDDETASDLAVEEMGNEAFDWILGELQAGLLTPRETVRALRLMARITRQFCIQRKGDLLDVVVALAENPSSDREVRSTAVHLAIMGARIAKRLQEPFLSYGRSVKDVHAQVSKAVRRALEIGVTPEIEAFTREFLSAIGDHR